MRLKISVRVITVVLAICHQICGQLLDSRFILGLGHFIQPHLGNVSIRCVGTLISQQHILTTASCVMVELPTEIAIIIEARTVNASLITPANRVFIHPHYVNNQNRSNNAAIVMTNAFRDNPNFLLYEPRSLSSIVTFESCNLFGWGGGLLDPRRDAVMVYSPQLCDPNFPQNFCSLIDSTLNPTCSAMLGSPLTCLNVRAVAGFLTDDESCDTNTGRIMLNYHSINDFRDWIVGVLGPELPQRSEVNFIVTVIQFTPPSTLSGIDRCFGTIITRNRVLTTASCATIQSPLSIAVRTRIVRGSTSSSVTFRTSAIHIHPNYRQEELFANNVAIIEVGGQFDQRIVPRSLGRLQSNSSCQLFGWGPTNFGFTRGDTITVHNSQLCDPSLPQAFCSSHPTIFHYSCNAQTGSPITCGDESFIAGLLINNASCSTKNGRVNLYFHSVDDFSTWIFPTDAGVTAKTPSVFVIFVVFMNSLIKPYLS